jgi:integrase
VDDARRVAAEAKDVVRPGGDPAEDRKTQVAMKAEERRARLTCADLLPGFEAWALARDGARGGKVTARYVGTLDREARVALGILEALALTPAEIRPRQIGSTLGRGKRGGAAVLRMQGLRSFFDYCVAEGALEANPCAALTRDEKHKPGGARQRVLDHDEVRAIWSAVENLNPQARDLIRFMMAVPARGGEVVAMRWRDIRGDHWHQAATLTKNGEAHRFFLSPIALKILDARADVQGGREPGALIFPGRTGKPIARNSIKAALDVHLGDEFDAWCLHDCRRTFASLLARSGCRLPESAIDGALNHKSSLTRGGVVGTYLAEPRRDEQDAAIREWGALFGSILGRDGGGNVVKLGRAT